MQTCVMEEKLETFLDKFSEQGTGQDVQLQNKQLPKFEESILSTSESGVLPLALGLAFSGTIGGILNNFFPLGTLALPVAGFLMMRFFKSGFLHGMGKGVLAAGIAALFGGLGGGLAGLFGGGGQQGAASSTGAGAMPVTW